MVACDEDEIEQFVDCRGEAEGTHEATYQVGAGTNGTFYYAITTEHGDGNITAPLDFNASSLYEPVLEITTPIRSPYNVQATFNPGTSQTTIQWINYNSINPVLPETGPDALQINVWQTDFKVNRDNGETLLQPGTPGVSKIATVSSTSTQYSRNSVLLLNEEARLLMIPEIGRNSCSDLVPFFDGGCCAIFKIQPPLFFVHYRVC